MSIQNLRWMVTVTTLLSLIIGCQPSPRSSAEMESFQSANSDSTVLESALVKYSYSERRGKNLYTRYCQHCHGSTGQGDGRNAYALNPRPRNLADSTFMPAQNDSALKQVITFGGQGTNHSILMPAYRHTLTPDEIQFVVDFIRTFSRISQPEKSSQ